MKEYFIVHIWIPRAFILNAGVLDPHCDEFLQDTKQKSQIHKCVCRDVSWLHQQSSATSRYTPAPLKEEVTQMFCQRNKWKYCSLVIKWKFKKGKNSIFTNKRADIWNECHEWLQESECGGRRVTYIFFLVADHSPERCTVKEIRTNGGEGLRHRIKSLNCATFLWHCHELMTHPPIGNCSAGINWVIAGFPLRRTA